ncbi:MAG: ATP-binding protein [Oscillospiraceae bacterium]|nr:ATP-binding protein [Oscillospiraceae bacterium]
MRNLEVGLVLVLVFTVTILSATMILVTGSTAPWVVAVCVSITILATVVAIILMRIVVKKSEAEFNQSDDKNSDAHERTLLMLDTCPMCMQIWSRDLSTIDCNEEGVRLYGFKDKQEYIDRFLADCSPEFQPDGQKSDEKAQALVFKAFDEGLCIFDWMHKMPDEDILIPCEITLVRATYKNEDVVIGYTRDIRKEKEIIEELKERDRLLVNVNAEAVRMALFTTLFDTIPDHVYAKDVNSRYTECNKSMLEYFNLKKEDVLGKDDAEALGLSLKDTKSFMEWDRKVMKSGIPARIEHRMSRLSGTSIQVETIKAPLIIGGETVGILGVSRDITRFKEMERRISADFENAKRLQAKADIASQHKTVFLATMSHEIRTPMNAILGATEVIMQSDSLPPGVYDWVTRIYNSGNLLLGIINDILDFSKIEAGKLEINISAYTLANIISDSIQLNLIRAESKFIEFVLEVDENIPAELIGDELRIKQILNNLLSNAFKFTESGKITLSFGFEPAAEDECIVIVMGVRDTGCGLSPEQQEKLFDEYTRFTDTNQAAVQGTGLGLSITRRLLDLMEGSISVESEPGVGTYFEVKLPQKKASDDILGADVTKALKEFTFTYDDASKRGRGTVDMMPYGSVLVVDDVETNRFVAVGLLMIFRLNVETASSGYEAISLIENGNTYDLIFMDHMMPGINGIEATKRIRALGYEAPIVALTANVASGNAEMFISHGFDGYLPKPVDIRQLTSFLNRFIRDKQPREVVDALRLQYAEMDAQKSTKATSEEETQQEGILTSHLSNLDIPGIDIIKGIAQYGGDVVSYYKILCSFAANVYEMLLAMETVSMENLPEYIINVHSVKGASYSVFANKIADKAKVLEDEAREDNLDFVLENNPPFLEEATLLITKLKEAMVKIDAAMPRNIKDKPDPDALGRLRVACEMYDMDGVDAAMEEIDAFTYENDGGLVVWVKSKVDLMAFSEIVAKIKEYLNN